MMLTSRVFRQPAARVGAAIVIVSSMFFACFAIPAVAAGPEGAAYTRHDLVFLPAARLAAMIRAGKVTSSELVEAYLEQIGRYNGQLNAIVTLDAEGARRRAREADGALARGEVWGPLHGVPVTIKDNYAVSGLRTTSGIRELACYVPDHDAAVVEKLRKAGAVILGKTSLPPLAMDVQTRSPIFGVTSNPWDLSRTTGGSSGGDAAAVAAGLTALGIGNDIGGSIRIPAHFCGIYGIKPTENLTSTFGVSPGMKTGRVRAVRHLSCCGPLARSVEDLGLALAIMAGPDRNSPEIPSVDLALKGPVALKGLRVTWTDGIGGVPVTGETRAALSALADRLAAEGCVVEKLSGPIFEAHLEAVKGKWKDLYRVDESDLPAVDFNAAWTTYGRLLDLELGTYQPSFFRFVSYLTGWWYRSGVPTISMVFPHSYAGYLQTLTMRDFFVNAMDEFLLERDVLLCPVTCTPAFEHMEPRGHFGPFPLYTDPVMVDGKPIKYLVANMSYTSLFNLTGNPVVVIPMGYTETGLPIGVQIVGRRWHDMELLAVAGAIDRVAGCYRRPDGY